MFRWSSLLLRSVRLIFFFVVIVSVDPRENSRTPKDSFLWKKNPRFMADEFQVAPNRLLYPDLPRPHTTVVFTAWYQTALSLVKTPRSAVLIGDSSLRHHLHLLIELEWHHLRLTQLKPVGRVRPQGFGKWSWSVGIVVVSTKILTKIRVNPESIDWMQWLNVCGQP